MKVKELVKDLLDMPMDADIECHYKDSDGDWHETKMPFVVNYEDGHVGILTFEKENRNA